MERSYWSGVMSHRTSRRRALAGTGMTAAAAALLAACGGGGSSDGDQDTASLVTPAVDTTKQAKRGGTIKDRWSADTPTLDIAAAVAPLNTPANKAYSTLVREKPGHLAPNTGKITSDLAESWEVSPDGLQITMKLRQGVKWHNKAPVNGRALRHGRRAVQLEALRGQELAALGIAELAEPGRARALAHGAGRAHGRDQAQGAAGLRARALRIASAASPAPWSSCPRRRTTAFDIRQRHDRHRALHAGQLQPLRRLHLQAQPGLLGQGLRAASTRSTSRSSPEYARRRWRSSRPATSTILRRCAPRTSCRSSSEEPRINIYAGRLHAQHERPDLRPAARGQVALPGRARAPGALDVLGPRPLHRRLPQRRQLPRRRACRSRRAGTTSLSRDVGRLVAGPAGQGLRRPTPSTSSTTSPRRRSCWRPPAIPTASTPGRTTSPANELGRPAKRMPTSLDGMAARSAFAAARSTRSTTPRSTSRTIRDGNGQYEGWAYAHQSPARTPANISPVGAARQRVLVQGRRHLQRLQHQRQERPVRRPAGQLDDREGPPRAGRREAPQAGLNDLQRYLAQGDVGLLVPRRRHRLHHGLAGARATTASTAARPVWTHYGLWVDETKPPFKSA